MRQLAHWKYAAWMPSLDCSRSFATGSEQIGGALAPHDPACVEELVRPFPPAEQEIND